MDFKKFENHCSTNLLMARQPRTELVLLSELMLEGQISPALTLASSIVICSAYKPLVPLQVEQSMLQMNTDFRKVAMGKLLCSPIFFSYNISVWSSCVIPSHCPCINLMQTRENFGVNTFFLP